MNLIKRAILAAVLIAGIYPVFAQAPAPVPALPDSERRTSYSISATTCACAVNFQLYGDSTDFQNWVEVWLNGVNVAYNDTVFGWTITSPSGPLANLARPISNAVLTFTGPQTGTVQIVGARRPRRVAQFTENAGVSARNINQAITDLVAQNRETWDRTNDIAGRAPLLPPGETMGTLPPLASRANMGVCFDSNGRFAPCVGTPSGSFAAGSGITFTGTGPTTIAANIAAGLGIAISAANPPVISVSPTNGVPIIPSRATAIMLDLHAYSVVQTGGYATAGDGGRATFVNVGATALLDTGASFTDVAGTHFQYLPETNGFINIKQFGAKVDWTATDGAATNDWAAIQNALTYAGLTIGPTIDAGGNAGATVFVPKGTALFCNGSVSLTVPYGVRLRGVNIWSSTLKLCDATMDSGTHAITICDPVGHLACFGSQIADITLFASSTPTSAANIAMVFSNNIQQMNFINRVAIYSGKRSCVQYDTGYGGAALVGIEALECTIGSTNPGINFSNIGTTLLKVKDTHVESGGGGVTANGVQMAGGFLDIDGMHTEGISTGIFANISGSTSNGMVRVHNVSGGVHCTNLVLRQTGSVANSVIVGTAVPNGCTNTVSNAGTLTTTPVVADTLY